MFSTPWPVAVGKSVTPVIANEGALPCMLPSRSRVAEVREASIPDREHPVRDVRRAGDREVPGVIEAVLRDPRLLELREDLVEVGAPALDVGHVRLDAVPVERESRWRGDRVARGVLEVAHRDDVAVALLKV